MDGVVVKLEVFEGPLDVLYHLIEKNEINIYDIPISMLTDQYLDYLTKISEIQKEDMDNMSEFILMAATLMEIKSKMLLPSVKNDEEYTDPREDLVAKLLEYKKFKEVTQQFKILQIEAEKKLYKGKDEGIFAFLNVNDTVKQQADEFLRGLTLMELYNAFTEVIKRKELKVDKVRGSFNSIEKDLYTIESKINYIKDLLNINSKIKFSRIFHKNTTKIEVVVTFLAVLELMKMRRIFVYQNSVFDEIEIMNNEGVYCEAN